MLRKAPVLAALFYHMAEPVTVNFVEDRTQRTGSQPRQNNATLPALRLWSSLYPTWTKSGYCPPLLIASTMRPSKFHVIEVTEMYNKPMLSVDQCLAAINAMIAEFNKNPNRRPVDMAIVDDAGNLLSYARMDRCLRPTYAQRKAYTSVIRRMDSGAVPEWLKERNMSLADLDDPNLITLGGGLVIINPSDGALVGGIGVGGLPTGEEDAEIARAGLKALNL